MDLSHPLPQAPADSTQTARITVLLVDDEPKILSGLRVALRKYPFDILTADSAQAALALLDEQPVDVLVSDEQMPQVSGSQLLAIVRQQHPRTVRIILTGHASLDAAVRAINEGEVYRFLTKPCNPIELAVTIQQGVQLRELAQQSSRLLSRAQQQQAVLRDLESRHPGISELKVDAGGAILLEAGDVQSLIRELERENR
jgi:two-component system probable response regulator PhcQ